MSTFRPTIEFLSSVCNRPFNEFLETSYVGTFFIIALAEMLMFKESDEDKITNAALKLVFCALMIRYNFIDLFTYYGDAICALFIAGIGVSFVLGFLTFRNNFLTENIKLPKTKYNPPENEFYEYYNYRIKDFANDPYKRLIIIEDLNQLYLQTINSDGSKDYLMIARDDDLESAKRLIQKEEEKLSNTFKYNNYVAGTGGSGANYAVYNQIDNRISNSSLYATDSKVFNTKKEQYATSYAATMANAAMNQFNLFKTNEEAKDFFNRTFEVESKKHPKYGYEQTKGYLYGGRVKYTIYDKGIVFSDNVVMILINNDSKIEGNHTEGIFKVDCLNFDAKLYKIDWDIGCSKPVELVYRWDETRGARNYYE